VRRETAEKYQVLLYLAAIGAGLAAGRAFPGMAAVLERAIWPALALLLYATFSQTPLVRLRTAFADARFLTAAVIGNFVCVPVLVIAAVWVLPLEPAVRLGVMLVLLVPCTDWFISFTHLGKGDTARAIAFAPLSLLLQLALLPVYIGLFAGVDATLAIAWRELLTVFAGLILLPLAAAFATEKWVEVRPERQRLLHGLAWVPIPMLATVLFLIAASQGHLAAGQGGLLALLAVGFGAYLVAAAVMAKALAAGFRLPARHGRVLAFSLGSRNSFVVLPIALALPEPLQLAVVVVVFQSLVELFGMAVYLWWIPERLFTEPEPA